MLFDFNIPLEIWLLVALLIAAAVCSIVARFIPMATVAKTADAQADLAEFVSPQDSTGKFPKLSVVVYNFSQEEMLLEYVATIMQQDYPNFEVILVNEGNNESTAGLSERLSALYGDKIYVTFIPPGSHNLSRRKLAQTLGIKAAKGSFILTTTSNCIIPSSSWLSLMMEPFLEGNVIDVVLGYSHINSSDLKGLGKWYREFDNVITATQWLSAAIRDKAYRGDGNNLAFRKKIFFEQKGYSKSIHLVNGDDDLFVNDITNDFNTQVMLAPETILSVNWEDTGNRMHADLKERYQFTSQLLPFFPFLKAGFASSMQWVVVLALVAAILLPLPNLFPGAIALALVLILFISQIVIYTKTAHRLGVPSPGLAVPFFLLWLPFGNLFFKLRHRKHRKKNFTFG